MHAHNEEGKAILEANFYMISYLALPIVFLNCHFCMHFWESALETDPMLLPPSQYLEEQARLKYRDYDQINIAIWNMHLAEDHHFDDVLETFLSRMGKGGGFRVVIFTGGGYLENRGDGGFENWLGSGNQMQDGKRITFQPVYRRNFSLPQVRIVGPPQRIA